MRSALGYYFLLIGSFFLPFNAICQNAEQYDSLIKLYQKDTFELDQQFKILYNLSVVSPSISDQFNYSKELLEKANSVNNEEYIILGYLSTGVSYRLKGNLSKAFEYLFKGANLAINNEAYELTLSNLYTEIATCYTLYGDSESALIYGDKTIEIQRKYGQSVELGVGLLNMGYDHYLLEDYQEALNLYLEAKQIFLTEGLTIGLAYVNGNTALVNWKQGQIESAIQRLNDAIESLTALDDRYAVADFHVQLGQIYFEQKQLEKAIAHTNAALELSQSEGLKEQIRDAYQLMYQIQMQLGNFEQALTCQSNYHAYKDSIYNQGTADLLANLNAEFELAQKEAEVELLLEQKRNNQLFTVAIGIALLAVIAVSLLIYFNFRSKSKLNRQLEEQKNNLMTLNETKDKFFSIISHDLRGPVNVISGLTSVIKKDFDDLSDGELREMINHTVHSASHLVKLLDNLLHWALQQRGMLPYDPQQVQLQPVIEEVVDLFEEMAKAKEISIQLQIERPVSLFVDRNALSTIIRNLLNNALKFSNENSTIEVIVKEVSNEQCSISVTDHGIGISREKLDKLFKLSEQNISYGTKGEKGMGLGLQLVYEFVQMNKGSISVHSQMDQGTTFILQFPTFAG